MQPTSNIHLRMKWKCAWKFVNGGLMIAGASVLKVAMVTIPSALRSLQGVLIPYILIQILIFTTYVPSGNLANQVCIKQCWAYNNAVIDEWMLSIDWTIESYSVISWFIDQPIVVSEGRWGWKSWWMGEGEAMWRNDRIWSERVLMSGRKTVI